MLCVKKIKIKIVDNKKKEYACLGWRNNYFRNVHTHNQLTKWKGSTWFRCEMNYEDKSSTISTLFVFWFEASLSPDTQSGSETKKKGFSEKYIYCSTEDLSSHVSSIFTFYIALNLNLFNFTLLQVALCSRGVLYSGVVLKMTVLNKMLRDSVPIFWLWGFYSLSVTASGNHPQEVMLQISPFSMYDHQILVSYFIRTLFHILSWTTSQNIYIFLN